MNRFLCVFILMAQCVVLTAPASECPNTCQSVFKGHRLLIGPEAYYTARHREGGTKQYGWQGGGRLLYDHIRRYKFYWAAEGALSKGTLSGHAGSGSKIKSTLFDRSIEGRIGYTLHYKWGCRFLLTPFIGMGYIIEQNNFKKPSPLHLRFKTSYKYATAGFLLNVVWKKIYSLGINVKLRRLLDPECKITRDPEYKKAVLKIDDSLLQYRIELPFTCLQKSYAFTVTPFYEKRSYGRQASYPFDFLKTTLISYGVDVQWMWVF